MINFSQAIIFLHSAYRITYFLHIFQCFAAFQSSQFFNRIRRTPLFGASVYGSLETTHEQYSFYEENRTAVSTADAVFPLT